MPEPSTWLPRPSSAEKILHFLLDPFAKPNQFTLSLCVYFAVDVEVWGVQCEHKKIQKI
jgi:hypothetical protein